MGIFACYLDENGEYQWTDKPDPNWKLIPEITKPDEIPIKTKVASSTQTSHLNQNPTPTPNLEPTLSPEPTPTRFSEKINADGSKTIYDYENKYTIICDKEGRHYHAYDDQNQEVYQISDGKAYFNLKNGYYIMSDKEVNIEDISSNMAVTTDQGQTFVLSDNRILKETTGDGVVYKYFYDEDGKYHKESATGDIIYYENDKEFKHIYPNNDVSINSDDGKTLVIHPNGDYVMYGDETTYGICEIDENNDIVCKDSSGNITVFNERGLLKKSIDKNGKIYEYDYDNELRTTTINGKKTYSKINHIEYDEESYNKIIKSLNSVGSSYQGVITSACSSIESAVNSFPDSYSSAGISSVGSSVNGHIGLISSLGEMTNYSILAYQTCDDSLEKGLYLLIDSLFGDSDTSLSEKFKKAISNTIEERDGIISYKEGTIFKNTSCIVDLLMNSPNITFLEGKVLEKFMKDHYLNEMDSMLIVKDKDMINGVEFDIYKIIDTNNLDTIGFNKYTNDCNNVISNVDKNVLKYLSNNGANIIYCSNYTVAPDIYNKRYAGLAWPDKFDALSVYDSTRSDDTEAILHEMGHTLDHCLYYDQTGEYGTTTIDGYDYGLMPNKTNTRELAHKEYGAYDPDYQYVADYSNDDSYVPCEFFAESFRNYYTTDAEKRERFACTIPETFEFFDNIEKWVGEQNANK